MDLGEGISRLMLRVGGGNPRTTDKRIGRCQCDEAPAGLGRPSANACPAVVDGFDGGLRYRRPVGSR